MDRIYRFSSWGLSCLATVLLGLGTLSLPDQALRANDRIPNGPLICPFGCHCNVLPCADDVCSAGMANCSMCTCSGTTSCKCT